MVLRRASNGFPIIKSAACGLAGAAALILKFNSQDGFDCHTAWSAKLQAAGFEIEPHHPDTPRLCSLNCSDYPN
jgi:hypothetical protein